MIERVVSQGVKQDNKAEQGEAGCLRGDRYVIVVVGPVKSFS